VRLLTISAAAILYGRRSDCPPCTRDDRAPLAKAIRCDTRSEGPTLEDASARTKRGAGAIPAIGAGMLMPRPIGVDRHWFSAGTEVYVAAVPHDRSQVTLIIDDAHCPGRIARLPGALLRPSWPRSEPPGQNSRKLL
jgi:hypothetical protein